MKTCSKCGIEAEPETFAAKKMGRPVCKACMRAYRNAVYATDPEAIRLRLKNYTNKARSRIAEAKAGPCQDCGVRYPPCVMEFDHRPGEEKLFNLSVGYKRSASSVAAEMAKCDVVCSNCHRLRTQFRRAVARW